MQTNARLSFDTAARSWQRRHRVSPSPQTPMHSIDEVFVVAAIQRHIGNEEPGDL